MKELARYFELFKELWSNRRYRSIIILACYVIFFSYILICLRTPKKNNITDNINNTNETIHQNTVSAFENNSNYKMTFMVNESKLYKYEKNKDLTLLEIDNVYYKVYYNILTGYDKITGKDLNVQTPNFTVKFWRFNKEVIAKMIKGGNVEDKRNNIDGEIETIYKVPSIVIFENINASIPILEGKDVKKCFIKLIITTKDSEIIKASLDLTDYYHLFEDNNQIYKLDLDFEEN